ncbi:glycosyltransferase family 9 protein [Robiginitalea marina]|uniref:Glycosyltransferase family 9 protein n=1 Tax=Robiginitalea marina TaxID=2954105 RepID=A0ABT1AXA4_9FLAO|nr:glycosyltransferase family 9 protein [Robiginitalea marina]
MKNGTDRPLLVLRFSALGDVAMAVPVLLALRRTYPGLPLLFATKSQYAPVLQKIRGVDVYPFEPKGAHRGIFGLFRFWRELKPLSCIAVADLHAVLRTSILRMFFGLSHTPFISQVKGRREKRKLTAWRKKEIRPLKSTQQRYADVFAALGFPVELRPGDVVPKESWPAFPGDRPGGHKVGYAPFAAHEGKCYPTEKTVAVIARLAKEKDLTVYLFGGGPGETTLLESWAGQFENCVCVAGKAGLSEELALISNLDLMVSMDSGNGHLAAMYGVPVLTVWGVTHPFAGFSPYNQPPENSLLADRERYPFIPTSVYGNKAPEGYDRVMDSIPPELIYRRVMEILTGK